MEYWYWEYIVKCYDVDLQEQIFSGIITAKNFSEAAAALEEYYDDNLVEIQMLKAVSESPVFEFDAAAEDDYFDFVFSKK